MNMTTKKRMGRPLAVLRWSPLLKISNHLVIDFSKNPIAHTLVFSERGDLNKILIEALDYYATSKGHPASTKEFQVKTVSSGVGISIPPAAAVKGGPAPVDFIAPVPPVVIVPQTEPMAKPAAPPMADATINNGVTEKPRVLSSFLLKQLSGD